MPSRQQEYRERHLAAGLCALCGEPLASAYYCARHAAAQRESRRRQRPAGATPRRTIPPEVVAAIRERMAAGAKYREISQELDVSYHSIWKYCRDIPRRRPAGRPRKMAVS
jgi:DNA invertase Pin-like site-specific DNA recombinase